jgi:hypothetical protein
LFHVPQGQAKTLIGKFRYLISSISQQLAKKSPFDEVSKEIQDFMSQAPEELREYIEKVIHFITYGSSYNILLKLIGKI